MYDFEFMNADGTTITHKRASSTTIAVNWFMGDIGRFERSQGQRAGTIRDDIIVTVNRKVAAVISDRGKMRPDVMIIEYMRRQILAAG